MHESLTAQQNGPSIEGPEGPRPTAMIVINVSIEEKETVREGEKIGTGIRKRDKCS